MKTSKPVICAALLLLAASARAGGADSTEAAAQENPVDRIFVVDESGKPVPDAGIRAGVPEELPRATWTRADAEGGFSFRWASPRIDAQVRASGFAPGFFHNLFNSLHQGRETVTMQRGIPLRGRTLDAAGKPAAGETVTLRLTNYEGIWYEEAAKTDREGRFAFRVLPQPYRELVIVCYDKETDRPRPRPWQVIWSDRLVEMDVPENAKEIPEVEISLVEPEPQERKIEPEGAEGKGGPGGFPVIPPVPGADPSHRRIRSVEVPTKLRLTHPDGKAVLSFDPDSFKKNEIDIGEKMIVGTELEVWVFEGEKCLFRSTALQGGIPDAKWTLPLPVWDVQRRRSLPLEVGVRITVFETDIPPQHRWAPKSAKYRILGTWDVKDLKTE